MFAVHVLSVKFWFTFIPDILISDVVDLDHMNQLGVTMILLKNMCNTMPFLVHKMRTSVIEISPVVLKSESVQKPK